MVKTEKMKNKHLNRRPSQGGWLTNRRNKMKMYYFASVEVILIDSEDVFTMIDLRGNVETISRSAGADMLVENEYHEIDQQEKTDILKKYGIELS